MGNGFIAGDYAGVFTKNVKFYYGYERENEAGDWLFEAEKDGKVLAQWTAKDLEVLPGDAFECGYVLLKGMAKFFDEWDIRHD